MKSREPSPPWADDFAMLKVETDRRLPGITQTADTLRRQLSATDKHAQQSHRIFPKEKSMLHRKPLITVLATIAILAILVPVSYAVVNTLFLSIDQTQSADEIADDVTVQLENAGVTDPQVDVEKDDHSVTISIQVDDPSELPDNIEVTGNAEHVHGHQRQVSVETDEDIELTQEQHMALGMAVAQAMRQLPLHEDLDAEDIIHAIREACAEHGFEDIDVAVRDDDIRVTVR